MWKDARLAPGAQMYRLVSRVDVQSGCGFGQLTCRLSRRVAQGLDVLVAEGNRPADVPTLQRSADVIVPQQNTFCTSASSAGCCLQEQEVELSSQDCMQGH